MTAIWREVVSHLSKLNLEFSTCDLIFDQVRDCDNENAVQCKLNIKADRKISEKPAQDAAQAMKSTELEGERVSIDRRADKDVKNGVCSRHFNQESVFLSLTGQSSLNIIEKIRYYLSSL